MVRTTREAASALRQADRGWDWTLDSSGNEAAARQVSSEDAQSEASKMITELINIGNEIRRK